MSSVLSTDRSSVYRTITDKIVAAIEAGAGAFVMPWHVGSGTGRPMNAVTCKPYQGVNVLALWAEAMLSDFDQGVWATFKQWKSVGAQVRRGEHGAAVIFYKPIDPERSPQTDHQPRKRFIAKASYVFNACQVEGWTMPTVEPSTPASIIGAADAFVRRTGAEIRHGSQTACYRPKADVIEMPDVSRFCGTPTSSATEAYYAVLLHELVHWTGSPTRLARAFGDRFGTEAYAFEELIAELGAAFLCADLEITNEPRADHAAYLSSWLTVLKADTRALFDAAKQAGRATEFLNALEPT